MGVAGLASLSGSAAVHDLLSWVSPPVLFALVVWMIVKVRRQVRSRSARWLLYLVLAALAIASVGGGYQTVRESREAKAYPPPGQLIDVGGHRLHLYCTGSGSPTVVLEPGHGGSSSDFGWITPAVARETRVCVYDRAGRGWSDAAAGPQDGAHIAADLHTLLERAKVAGPYVLAGHSFGGWYVRSFAAHFPDQVAGMVLLDSTAPNPGPAQPAGTESYSLLGRGAVLLPAVAHLGAGRLLNPISYGTLPARSRDEARANSATAKHLASWIEEAREGSAPAQQADTGNDSKWQSEQDKMARLSTNSVHRVAHDTTHQSLLDDEADSAAASKAIHDVVTAVRTSHRLRPR